MRGFTYHVAPTSKPGVIKIRPTKTTYAKAYGYGLGPTVLILVGLGVYGSLQERRQRREQEKHDQKIPKKK